MCSEITVIEMTLEENGEFRTESNEVSDASSTSKVDKRQTL